MPAFFPTENRAYPYGVSVSGQQNVPMQNVSMTYGHQPSIYGQVGTNVPPPTNFPYVSNVTMPPPNIHPGSQYFSPTLQNPCLSIKPDIKLKTGFGDKIESNENKSNEGNNCSPSNTEKSVLAESVELTKNWIKREPQEWKDFDEKYPNQVTAKAQSLKSIDIANHISVFKSDARLKAMNEWKENYTKQLNKLPKGMEMKQVGLNNLSWPIYEYAPIASTSVSMTKVFSKIRKVINKSAKMIKGTLSKNA